MEALRLPPLGTVTPRRKLGLAMLLHSHVRPSSSTRLLLSNVVKETTMPIRAFVVVLPMLFFLIAGCGAPPTAEADAARQSIASASSAGADKYAAASLWRRKRPRRLSTPS